MGQWRRKERKQQYLKDEMIGSWPESAAWMYDSVKHVWYTYCSVWYIWLILRRMEANCCSHGDIYIASSRVIFSPVYFVGACVCTLASIIRACAEDVLDKDLFYLKEYSSYPQYIKYSHNPFYHTRRGSLTLLSQCNLETRGSEMTLCCVVGFLMVTHYVSFWVTSCQIHFHFGQMSHDNINTLQFLCVCACGPGSTRSVWA